MSLQEKLEQTLAQMGETPEEIAAFLEGQGIRSFRNDPWRCVVADHLTMTFGGTLPFVTSRAILLYEPVEMEYTDPDVEPPIGPPIAQVACSEAMRDFVRLFDRYEYPNLTRS